MARRFGLVKFAAHCAVALIAVTAGSIAAAGGADAAMSTPVYVDGAERSERAAYPAPYLNAKPAALVDLRAASPTTTSTTDVTRSGVAKPKSKIKKSTLWLMIGLLAAIAVSSLVSAKKRAKRILEG